jgi:TetR/AcrR family transcriptional regulator, transcriptional repressor of aconitase
LPKVSDEHREQRKQQILLAAQAVFIRKGYEKTTLKDIVEQVGMSRGWIYLYFQDKVEIFKAILTYLDDQMNEQFMKLKNNYPLVETALESYFEDCKETILTLEDSIHPAIYEFCVTGWRDPELREFFTRRYDRVVLILMDLLKKGVDTLEFNPALPLEVIVKRLMSSMDGIMMQSLAFSAEKVDSIKQIEQLELWVKQALMGSKTV